MSTFDRVDGFIRTMERNGVGLAAQSNAYDKLKSILLDAHRLGLFDDNPLLGVKAPQYDPKRAVIPSPAQLQDLRGAGDDIFRLTVDLMSGCGLRKGEAAAVNVNNIVADDIYRVTEQVNQTTKKYGRLKHRKPGEYRDVPLPQRTKNTIEWYADQYGTTTDGYLLRHPRDSQHPFQPYLLQNQWQRLKARGARRTGHTRWHGDLGRVTMPAQFMTAKELAEHLNMSLVWVYREAARSGLTPYRFGPGRNAKIQFKVSEVQTWIGQHRSASAA